MRKCVLCGHLYEEEGLCCMVEAPGNRDTDEYPEEREEVIEEGICPSCAIE